MYDLDTAALRALRRAAFSPHTPPRARMKALRKLLEMYHAHLAKADKAE